MAENERRSNRDWREQHKMFLEACLKAAEDKATSNENFRSRIATVALHYLDVIKEEEKQEKNGGRG